MKKIACVLLLAFGCSQPTPTAQEVVDQAIAAAGVEILNQAEASFTFRGISYSYSMDQGSYAYTRIQLDSAGNQIRDILTNDGLKRYINDSLVNLTLEKQEAYTSSVNSVIYFAFLPFHLNDQAVNKTHAGTVELKGKTYHKIKVTFDADGGGEDYEDVFYYWFDTEDYSMDYLAYSYQEEDGVGMRFRVAYHPRMVNGVMIQDYKNLKPKKDHILLDNIDRAYLNGQLTELSIIVLDQMKITY